MGVLTAPTGAGGRYGGSRGGPHLLLGQVLVALGLLDPKLVVHLLAALADVLPLAQVVDVRQPLLGLPLRLAQDVLDFGVVLPENGPGVIEGGCGKQNEPTPPPLPPFGLGLGFGDEEMEPR